MSTKNKWQALSMRDRAFLIKEAVRKGITDLDNIRDTWEHRFDGKSDQSVNTNEGILDKERIVRNVPAREWLPGLYWTLPDFIVRHEYSGEDNTIELPVDENSTAYAIAYLPKDENGIILHKGMSEYRKAFRKKADDLLARGLSPEDEGFLSDISSTNKKLNRIYNRRARKKSYEDLRANRALNTKSLVDLGIYAMSPVFDAITASRQAGSPTKIHLNKEQSNTNSRDFFNELNMVSTAFGRGDISYDEIPDLYKPYLAKTREEQQQRWYKQAEDSKAFDQIMQDRGWNQLEKLYGIGMSSLLGGAYLSSALPPVFPEASVNLSKEAIKQELQYLRPDKELLTKLGKDFLVSLGTGMTVNEGLKAFTDKSWGQHMVATLPETIQKMPFTQNYGESIGEFTNPFYMVNANMAQQAVNTAANVLSSPLSIGVKTAKGIKNFAQKYNPFTISKRISEYNPIKHELHDKIYKLDRLRNQSAIPDSKISKSHKIRYRSYRPFYSNNIDVIQQHIPETYKVTRKADNIISIEIPNSLTSKRNFNPELKLPSGDQTKVRLTDTRLSGGGSRIILTYPSAKGGKPIVDIEEIPLSKMEHILNNNDYYQLPEIVIQAMERERNIAFSQIPGMGSTDQIKLFGSMATAPKKAIPTISDDVDVMMSRSYYDRHVEGKLPFWEKQKTPGGVTLSYEIDRKRKPLDVVLLENGKDGLANSNSAVAWELFAKQDPVKYNQILNQSVLSGESPKIPVTAEELIKNVDSYLDTIFDAFIAADKPSKLKHLGRVPLFIERADINTLREVIKRKGQLFFGENYKPVTGIDYSNPEANAKFLEEIGYVGENLSALAANPERMEIVVQDYYQYLSSVSRIGRFPNGLPKTKETVVQVQTQWSPGRRGGAASGGFKNAVSLGHSSEAGDFGSNMQLDLNLYLPEGSTPDVLAKLSKEMRGAKPFDAKQKDRINSILRKVPGYEHVEVNDGIDLLRWGQDFYYKAQSGDYFTQQQVDNLMSELSEIIPYAEGGEYTLRDHTGRVFRGFMAKPTAHTFFPADNQFMDDVTFGTNARYSALPLNRGRNTTSLSEEKQIHRRHTKISVPPIYKQRLENIESAFAKRNANISKLQEDYEIRIQNAEDAQRHLSNYQDAITSIVSMVGVLSAIGAVSGAILDTYERKMERKRSRNEFVKTDTYKQLKEKYKNNENQEEFKRQYKIEFNKWKDSLSHEYSGESSTSNNKYFWNYLSQYAYEEDNEDSLQQEKEYREKYGHQFSGEGEPQRSAPSWWERFKTMNALQGGDPDTPIFIDYRDMQKADNQEAAKLFEEQNKAASELDIKKGKATVNALAFIGGLKNPFGLLGDLGITTASTAANTVLDGDTENLWNNLKTGAAWDLAGGVLQWLPKAIKGGKRVVKNIKSLNEDFVVRPSVPKVKAMLGLSPKWYNFPNGYEFHFATATPKKYMGELFYAPALEKAATKTAEISKTPLIDAIKKRKIPQYETTYIQLDGKTLNDIMDEPISLYVSASPTKVGGYSEVKGSNVDISSSLPGHTSSVHEIKHDVQRATNAAKVDITEYALGDYRRFPRHEALKSGYHKILADQADFLKELDTGLPADSADTVTELVFQTNASRNIQELNATVAESLYKMFKNRLPYHDERFMTKEMLDLYKTEIAQMTSEEFMKEFSRDANAYARDYIRGIEEIKKKDPARAEYLIKRLKDLVINQYF